MAKIIHEAGGIELINGIEFKPGEEGWETGDLTAEQIALFDNVPGFRVEGEIPAPKAQAPAPKPAAAPKPATAAKGASKKAAEPPAAPAQPPAEAPAASEQTGETQTGEGGEGAKNGEDDGVF